MGMKEQAAAATRWMIERIEGALESGEKLTWASGCESGLPMNFTTGKRYRGWNIFRCWMTGHERQLWAGSGQIKKAGGRVRSEEWKNATWILLWQRRESKELDSRGEPRVYWYSKALKVWNIDQCEGLPEDVVAAPAGAEEVPEMDDFFDAVLEAEGITLEESSLFPAPCYNGAIDRIGLPERKRFTGAEERHAALAHELVHATGHAKRLDREMSCHRVEYSKEELVAEFGAAILGAMLGFDGAAAPENHAAYLRGWLSALGDDPTLLGSAASAAQKAVDRIMDKAGSRVPETTTATA